MSEKEILEKILNKQDKMSEDMTEVKITLAKQEENIKTHIRRTEIAETNIDLIRREIDPVKNHVKAIQAVLKFFGAVGIGATLITAVINLIKILF